MDYATKWKSTGFFDVIWTGVTSLELQKRIDCYFK